MGKVPLYKVKLKRRREGKTSYRLRRGLILSRKPLLAIRKTNRHIIAQIIKPKPQGDEVLVYATSTELVRKYGWKFSTKNCPAAYLTGYLLGLRALKHRIERAVLNIGLHRPIRGCNLFAALKGAMDAGLNVPHDEEILPNDDRVRGKHIAKYAEKLSRESPQAYIKRFSKYLSKEIKPEEIVKHFEEVLAKLKKEV